MTEVKKGMAIAAIATGITGLILAFIPYICVMGWILGILAIVFGGIGIAQTNKNPNHEGRALAITGLVTGILSFIAPFISTFIIYAAILSSM